MTLRYKHFEDSGVYLADPQYQGIYHGQQIHLPDVDRVLSRAWDYGLDKMVVIGTRLSTNLRALELAKSDERLFCTVGCTPRMIYEMHDGQQTYTEGLYDLIRENKRKVVAVGECGLDYSEEGVKLMKKRRQLRYLDWQMAMAKELRKPMLLTCSPNAFSDLFTKIMKYHRLRGVIHNFCGTAVEAREAIRKGYYIGISGCSLATKEGIKVAKQIPLNRLILESGAPFCDWKKPHAGRKHLLTTFCDSKKSNAMPDGFVTGRSEPAHLIHVVEALAGVRKMEAQELMDVTRGNVTELMFHKKTTLPPY